MKIEKEIALALTFILLFYGCENVEQRELKKGKTAFDKGEYYTAISYCKKTLIENPKNSEACLLLGKSYLELEYNYLNTAIDYLHKSIEYNSSNPEAYVFLGDAYQSRLISNLDIYTVQKALESGKAPVSDEAIACYQKAININPNFALAYYRLAYHYGFNKDEVEEGINLYNKGISENDNFTNIYLNLGKLYLKKNDIQNAIENFKTEISRNPSNHSAYFILGKVLVEQYELEEAKKYLDLLALIEPNYEGLYYYLGLAYIESNPEKAIEHFKASARMGDNRSKELLSKRNIKW